MPRQTSQPLKRLLPPPTRRLPTIKRMFSSRWAADGSSAKINVECFGECGCVVSLRKSKVRSAQYYLCGSKAHGNLCEAKLPPLPPGMVRSVEINAAAHFWGYTDEWPDAEMTESIQRAREVLAAGIAKLAIAKARNRG